MEDCVFCRIAKGTIPVNFVYQDDQIAVFPDKNPIKPTHLLLIPKKHIADLTEIDNGTLGKIKDKVVDLTREKRLIKTGYRVVINGGAAMGVPHLHFHLLAPVGVTEKI